MSKPFEPGHKLSTGRPKGSKNKDTETIAQICLRKNLSIAEVMVDTILDPHTSLERRDNYVFTLARYLYAQPKAIEISGSLGIDTSRQDEELAKLRAQVKERIKERK